MINLWLIFLTGLTIGGLTCLAVQGGLLASVVAAREGNTVNGGRHAFWSLSAFLAAKFLAYLVLGFLLGAFGGALNIDGWIQSLMQLLAGLYMVAVALNLLNIHPIFRYVIIQPPRILNRLVKDQAKSKDIFAPAILGALTIFIPCGTTLAMEALAISSANALVGALVLGVFTLGTMPLFLGIGFVTSFLGETFKTHFLRLAAVIVLYLGVSSVNGALTALGSPLTFETLAESFPVNLSLQSGSDQKGSSATTTQDVEINIISSGYSPNYIRVKKGLPVTIRLNSQNAYGCASAFRIPSLGVTKNLQPNEKQIITFTPQQVGRIPFSCVMGMYRGVIEVI